nr:hypothetical protein [uncultured Marinifilum sp.]
MIGEFKGFIFGILSKIIAALSQFIMIPLLIGFYGKGDYGLFVLAFSLNAYLRLMELGVSNGSIRFFAIWFAKGETNKVKEVSRSSMVFYGVIGVINTIVFLLMGVFSNQLFSLDTGQYYIFLWLMIILASSTIFNWLSFVVVQLLTAFEGVAWINQMNSVKSILNLLAVFICVKFEFSLAVFFIVFTLTNMVIIPLNLYRFYRVKLSVVSFLKPRWNYPAFKEVLMYSLSLFAMGIFQMSALYLQPVILGAFADNGVMLVADYEIIRTISSFVIVLGGVFMQVLLPKISKLYAEKDVEKINQIIYDGTKLISLFVCFVVFNIVINTQDILNIYLGSGYNSLVPWLNVSLFTVLYMHNSAISTLILATGKTKVLVYASAISCFSSLLITMITVSKFGVGAAIIGYAVYISIQMLVMYFYYMPFVLNINPTKVFFQSFMPFILISLIVYYFEIVLFNMIDVSSIYIIVLCRCLFFSLCFILLCYVLMPRLRRKILVYKIWV